uniref:Uncharacterized protein n=1 Tax=Arion vulgaris TaxID=1028688 RepID=A0A0B7A0G6_9EUPU
MHRILDISRRDRFKMKTSQKRGKASLLNLIKKQLKWFGHISRLPTDSAPQRAMLLIYSGYKAKAIHTKGGPQN